jgi:hypothetical protein
MIQLYPNQHPNTHDTLQYPSEFHRHFELPHYTTNRAFLDLRCLVPHLLSMVRGKADLQPWTADFQHNSAFFFFGDNRLGGYGTALVKRVFSLLLLFYFLLSQSGLIMAASGLRGGQDRLSIDMVFLFSFFSFLYWLWFMVIVVMVVYATYQHTGRPHDRLVKVCCLSFLLGIQKAGFWRFNTSTSCIVSHTNSP